MQASRDREPVPREVTSFLRCFGLFGFAQGRGSGMVASTRMPWLRDTVTRELRQRIGKTGLSYGQRLSSGSILMDSTYCSRSGSIARYAKRFKRQHSTRKPMFVFAPNLEHLLRAGIVAPDEWYLSVEEP